MEQTRSQTSYSSHVSPFSRTGLTSSGSIPQGYGKGVFCIVNTSNYKHVLRLSLGFSSP